MKTLEGMWLITGVTALAFVMAAPRAAVAADRYLDTSASVGLQGSSAPKWTNTIWSVDIGGTNRTNIASNDNVFVQVETGKALGTLSIPAVPAGTNYYVNDITVGNGNSVNIGGANFGFNIAGNITVQGGSYLKFNGSGVFALKPKTTTGLTIQGGSTNVYDAGASAKGYTMGSLVFGDGDNRLELAAAQTLTFSSISGGSSNVIALGNASAKLTINGAGESSFAGLIQGPGALSKSGSGTLILSGENTFSNATTLSAGTLVVSNQLALQNSTLGGTAGNLQFGAEITDFTLGGLGLAGTLDVALTNQSGAAVRLKIGQNNADTTCDGALSESGGITKIGSGTLTLGTGPHPYTGDTVVEEGTLAFTAALGPGRIYNGAISNEGWFVWNTVSAETFNGVISGGGTIIKKNTYSLTFNATNTYSGVLIVSNGTLKVANPGSLSTNSSLLVASGGSVDMNGKTQACVSVGGTGFVTNGTLNVTAALYPGGSNSVGTLTLGNLILATGTTVHWDYDGGAGDTNKVLGTATLPASATVLVNASETLPSRAVLFDCDSIEAPGGVGGWTVKGTLPNSFVKVEGSQLLLITIKGTVISFQ